MQVHWHAPLVTAWVQEQQTPLYEERRMSATAQPLSLTGTVTTRVRVNGRAMSVTHEARVSLLDLLRERLQLTGTKKGCNEGACGGCTVLGDGRRVNGGMVLAASCEGRAVARGDGRAGPA